MITLMVLAFTVLCASTAFAQIEVIDTFSIYGIEEERSFGPFDNDIPPEPVEKLFKFEGVATNPHTQPRRLAIFFDYYVGNQEMIINPPNEINTIPGNAVNHRVVAAMMLDFCPEQVSIHFETLDGSIEDITGAFTHTCWSDVPTLTEWGLIIFGVVLVGFITYVFLRRRKAVVGVQ